VKKNYKAKYLKFRNAVRAWIRAEFAFREGPLSGHANNMVMMWYLESIDNLRRVATGHSDLTEAGLSLGCPPDKHKLMTPYTAKEVANLEKYEYAYARRFIKLYKAGHRGVAVKLMKEAMEESAKQAVSKTTKTQSIKQQSPQATPTKSSRVRLSDGKPNKLHGLFE
jgi:hypothetical protein